MLWIWMRADTWTRTSSYQVKRSKEKLIIVNIDIIKSYYLNISILGCLRDEVFVDILENFDADKLWGKFGL